VPEPDPHALLTILTTEHFTLQGAPGSTVSESSARAALDVGALSRALIALGFIAQAAKLGTAFNTFALVMLPTLYLLGVFTFVRLVESSVANLLYGLARGTNYVAATGAAHTTSTSTTSARARRVDACQSRPRGASMSLKRRTSSVAGSRRTITTRPLRSNPTPNLALVRIATWWEASPTSL
jgi:hypothetical protein